MKHGNGFDDGSDLLADEDDIEPVCEECDGRGYVFCTCPNCGDEHTHECDECNGGES